MSSGSKEMRTSHCPNRCKWKSCPNFLQTELHLFLFLKNHQCQGDGMPGAGSRSHAHPQSLFENRKILFIIFSCAGSFLLHSLPLVVESGSYSACGAWVSHCSGFFCWVQASVAVLWAQELWFLGSRSTGSSVVAHGLSYSVAYEIFPDQGLNPRSLTVPSRFFTTEPPGEFPTPFLKPHDWEWGWSISNKPNRRKVNRWRLSNNTCSIYACK